MAIEPEGVAIPPSSLVIGLPECPDDSGFVWRWHSGERVEVQPFELGKYVVCGTLRRDQQRNQCGESAGGDGHHRQPCSARRVFFDDAGFESLGWLSTRGPGGPSA